MKQKGLTPIVIVVLIATLAVGGYLIYKLPRTSVSPQTPQTTPVPTPSSTPDETANWKTFTSDEFSFKYPSNWSLSDCGDPRFIYLDEDGINCAGGFSDIAIAKNRFPDGSYVFAKENLIEKRVISLSGKDALQSDFTDSGFRYTVTRVKIGNSIYDITVNPDFVLNKLPKRDVYDQILSTFKFTN